MNDDTSDTSSGVVTAASINTRLNMDDILTNVTTTTSMDPIGVTTNVYDYRHYQRNPLFREWTAHRSSYETDNISAINELGHRIYTINAKSDRDRSHIIERIIRLDGTVARIENIFLMQIQNQNNAIMELSKIIDDLKQNGFNPDEPLEDIE